jgi:CheY-like chemotaxis protein
MSGTVLIVDADQGFTESAQLALEAQGVTVHVRDDASLDIIRKIRPTVMMLNVELPKGASTGFSICSRVRRDRELKATPILLTSSEASVEALKKHAQSNDRADDYARKPLAVEDVVARIGRLLASAPPPDPSAQNGGLEEDAAKSPHAASPAARRGTAMPDPGSEGEGDQEPLLDEFGSDEHRTELRTVREDAPPPIRREAKEAPLPNSADELWKSQRIDEALKPFLDTQEPQAPAKATPEERLAFLRQLVKYLETKDKVLRDLWSQTQQNGVDLARRTVSISLDLQSKEKRLNEILLDRDNVHRRLVAVETEFKTFQDEITRIFRDKDAEEDQSRLAMGALEKANEELTKSLKEARERTRDDERRLEIFQDEVGDLTAQKEEAENRIDELTRAHDGGQREVESLSARLSTAENVAAERADEIEDLREKNDNFALTANQDRQHLEREHADAVTAMEVEHEQQLAQLQDNHRRAMETELERHEEFLETLTSTHEAEITSIEEERDQANARSGDLGAEVHELEQKLKQTQAEAAAETGALKADIEALEEANRELDQRLVEAQGSSSATSEERDELSKQLEGTSLALSETNDQLEALRTQLDDERAESRQRTDELEKSIEAERAEKDERIRTLEEELDVAQNDAFEQHAELEQLRKGHDKFQSKNQNLDTSLKISEKALSAAESRAKALDEEVQQLKQQLEGLEAENEQAAVQNQRLEKSGRDKDALLEKEREKSQRAEEMLQKARDRIAELLKNLEATEKKTRSEADEAVRKERARAADLEKQLASAQTELASREEHLSRKEAELGGAYAQLTDLERKLEEQTRERQIEAEEMENELRRTKQEFDALRSTEGGTRSRLETLERDLKALEAAEQALLKEVEVRDEKVRALEERLEHDGTQRRSLEQELTIERDRSGRFSRLNEDLRTRQTETMGRVLRALGAGSEVLKKIRSQDEEAEIARAIRQYADDRDQPDFSALDRALSELNEPRASAPTEPLKPSQTEPLKPSQTEPPKPSQKPPSLPKLQPPTSKSSGKDKAARRTAPPAQAPSKSSGDEPFAALVAELQAVADHHDQKPRGPKHKAFDESFLNEATTADPVPPQESKRDAGGRPKGTRTGAPPPPRPNPQGGGTPKKKEASSPFEGLADLISPSRPRRADQGREEEEEGGVTEIIHLDDVK